MAARPSKSPYAFLPTLARLKRGGTVAHVQDLIRDAIVQLALPPGTFVDKAALCERLGVSRFPVSEALGRLAAEGLVEIVPQRGTLVARIRLADVHEAMFIRRALEVDAMRAIATHGERGFLAKLQTNMRKQEAAMRIDDRPRFHQLDLAFHKILLDVLDYERVRAAVDASRASLDRVRLFLCTPQRQSATYAEHQAIVAALAARDATAAGHAMEAHLDAVMAELVAFSAEHPESFERQASDEAAA